MVVPSNNCFWRFSANFTNCMMVTELNSYFFTGHGLYTIFLLDVTKRGNFVSRSGQEVGAFRSEDRKEYLSIDTIVDDENEYLQNSIPIEFVNLITLNGLPPHKLILKIGYYNFLEKFKFGRWSL